MTIVERRPLQRGEGPVNCKDCPPKNSRSGEVAVGGGLTVIQEYFLSKLGRV